MSALDILRAAFPPVNLADHFDFQQTTVRGVSLSVDPEARKRIAAIAEVARPGTMGMAAIPLLIAMLDQDRTSGVSEDVVAAFKSGGATSEDGRRAENMVWLAEADAACQVAAQDALARIGSGAVRALIEALHAPQPNRRIGAAKALGQIGLDAQPALTHLDTLAKSDGSEPVRKAASEAIKLIKPRRWF
jgi:HEAT repeat protein